MRFELSENQKIKLDQWNKKHILDCPYYRNSGASGGRLTYSFTPIGVGDYIKVICACSKSIDLSEYENW